MIVVLLEHFFLFQFLLKSFSQIFQGKTSEFSEFSSGHWTVVGSPAPSKNGEEAGRHFSCSFFCSVDFFHR